MEPGSSPSDCVEERNLDEVVRDERNQNNRAVLPGHHRQQAPSKGKGPWNPPGVRCLARDSSPRPKPSWPFGSHGRSSTRKSKSGPKGMEDSHPGWKLGNLSLLKTLFLSPEPISVRSERRFDPLKYSATWEHMNPGRYHRL
jgi:hypothetical protein